MSDIVIVSCHVDDEVLGCGGLLAHHKLLHLNDKIHVVFCVVDSHKQYGEVEHVYTGNRLQEAEEVAKYLNYNYEILWKDLGYHLRLDSIPQEVLITEFENMLNRLKPTWLFMPWYSNYNQDHRAISTALFTALRPMPKEFKHYVPNVLYYDEPTHNVLGNEHVFTPNYILPLTEEEVGMKLTAISGHKTQLRYKPNLRSLPIIEATMKLRGAQVAESWGEGYHIMRMSKDIL